MGPRKPRHEMLGKALVIGDLDRGEYRCSRCRGRAVPEHNLTCRPMPRLQFLRLCPR
jgi:hypothetical protein